MSTVETPRSHVDAPRTSASGVTYTVPAARGMAVRSLRNIRRLPSAFLPALLMPIVQCVAFSGTFYAITRIPGFPTDRSINWFMPLAVVMGSSFAGIGVGLATVRDLENGFYDRLRMAPAPRRALLLGPLLSAWARVLLVVTIVLAVGVLLGARLTGGVLGIVPLYLAGLGVSVVSTGWALGLAYRFRDMRAAAIMQLTLFLSLFLTTAQAPLDVMDGWLRDVARLNPLTRVLDLARTGFLDHPSVDTVWPGLIALVALGVPAMVWARTGLNRLDR